MQCSITTPFLAKVPTLTRTWTANILLVAALGCGSFAADAQPQSQASDATSALTEYSAEYHVTRQGERHGKARRALTRIDDSHYQLSYRSDIEWMIFSDEREETSRFQFSDGEVTPIYYTMERTGTGPDKEYKISFDHSNQQVFSNESKYALDCPWKADYQDVLSYQIALRKALAEGQERFAYPIVDKKGNSREYAFEVVGTETITLPIGNVETVKVKRLYDNDKRQAIAWFAPKMNYMMVRMYKGKDGVEQFQVELAKYVPYTPL
ncbi:DUF3108 domain-containing protein [Pseudoalteromonas ruthenica]|uniref:DUF3108 domain-containing protein n=1 Tax=Pseudoalteromonas ruthenica TaxID=151081 RepID=UPI0009E4CEEC|nr:DUF3108 domain-containing protein [Pseudoalteromonas ruthenica]TMO88086.1 DUF3108 domain-containing protein [Pseudoalteromonas ruthenica]TMO92346.1 DUF3108 domain-containing protein [Pseudoalteromonas ruthenica]TMO96142.1 DUF3108 domain-containing protein [Pseudoalteromonas ruthenica]TMP07873.1 DUF3108 domain-containing protein [Pseudoalteromonas ruthenica]TMP11051.1 DUF3108 domain-containing protein [Pseudoalteromonas ruthenica]